MKDDRTLPEPCAQPTVDYAAAVFGQLRPLASRLLAANRDRATIQTTELVHEVISRFMGDAWETEAVDDPGNFLQRLAVVMRGWLAEHLRQRAVERSGEPAPADLAIDDVLGMLENAPLRLGKVLGAIETLAADCGPGPAAVAALHVGLGLGHSDCAAVLGRDAAAVEQDWLLARAVLGVAIADGFF